MANIINYKAYHANKLASAQHNSIWDMVVTRYKIEKFLPYATFTKSDYNKKVRINAESFYKESGVDYLVVDELHDDKTVSLDINRPKLEMTIGDIDGYFENLNQVLSIVAIGNAAELVRSHELIDSALRHNKHVKSVELLNKAVTEKQKSAVKNIASSCKEFEDKIEFLKNRAHEYVKQQTMNM